MDRIKKYLDIFNIDVQLIENVPESYSSEVYKLILNNGQTVILKIPYSSVKLIRETEMLKKLADKLPVPRVLKYWEGTDRLPGALLLSYIDGRSIEGKIDQSLAYQLGELLAKVHSIPMKHYTLVAGEREDWWASIKSVFDGWLNDCQSVLSRPEVARSNQLYKNFMNDMPPVDGPLVVHMDYRPANILVKDNKIAGLIDFESSRGGSSGIDFTKSKLYVWDQYQGSKKEFISGYTSIRPLPAIDREIPFYLFYNALGGISWCVRRGQTEGDFFEENIEQLRMFF